MTKFSYRDPDEWRQGEGASWLGSAGSSRSCSTRASRLRSGVGSRLPPPTVLRWRPRPRPQRSRLAAERARVAAGNGNCSGAGPAGEGSGPPACGVSDRRGRVPQRASCCRCSKRSTASSPRRLPSTTTSTLSRLKVTTVNHPPFRPGAGRHSHTADAQARVPGRAGLPGAAAAWWTVRREEEACGADRAREGRARAGVAGVVREQHGDVQRACR